MSEENKAPEAPSNEELLNLIKGMQAQQPAAPAQQAAPTGWEQPAPVATNSDIQAVSIPINLETEDGKIRVYLQLPAEVASSPEALMQAIEGLKRKGLPLDFWRKKEWNGNKKKSWS